MTKNLAFILFGASLCCSPAWAINKCTGPGGGVVFQDAPCAGKGETLIVRPSTGHAARAPQVDPVAQDADGVQSAKPQTEAQRIERQIAESQKKRKIVELEARLVPDAEAAISRNRSECDQKMKALQAKKALANNNLAGATWEGSISGEMTALATTCDTRNRELRDNASRLRSECQRLGGCK